MSNSPIPQISTCIISVSTISLFTWHNVFKIQSCCSTYKTYSFLRLHSVLLYVYTTFTYPFILWWAFGFFPYFGYRKYAVVYIDAEISLMSLFSILLSTYPEAEMLNCIVIIFMSKFSRNHHWMIRYFQRLNPSKKQTL